MSVNECSHHSFHARCAPGMKSTDQCPACWSNWEDDEPYLPTPAPSPIEEVSPESTSSRLSASAAEFTPPSAPIPASASSGASGLLSPGQQGSQHLEFAPSPNPPRENVSAPPMTPDSDDDFPDVSELLSHGQQGQSHHVEFASVPPKRKCGKRVHFSEDLPSYRLEKQEEWREWFESQSIPFSPAPYVLPFLPVAPPLPASRRRRMLSPIQSPNFEAAPERPETPRPSVLKICVFAVPIFVFFLVQAVWMMLAFGVWLFVSWMKNLFC